MTRMSHCDPAPAKPEPLIRRLRPPGRLDKAASGLLAASDLGTKGGGALLMRSPQAALAAGHSTLVSLRMCLRV
jgi:hypothetical protein